MVELVAISRTTDETAPAPRADRAPSSVHRKARSRAGCSIDWDEYVAKFVKVLPTEYRKVLERQHLDANR